MFHRILGIQALKNANGSCVEVIEHPKSLLLKYDWMVREVDEFGKMFEDDLQRS